jgi:hypothetical protein
VSIVRGPFRAGLDRLAHSRALRFFNNIIGKGQTPLPRNVKIDDYNNIFITGLFLGDLTFENVTLRTAGSFDVFIASYSLAGSLRWAKRFGNENADSITSMTIDPDGHVMISADFTGIESYGGASFTAAGGGDIILADLDSVDGSHLASTHMESSGSAEGQSISVTERSIPDGYVVKLAPFH